jgi:hypothetical protein
MVFTLYTNYLGTLLIFQKERPVFLREQAAQLYGVAPYYLAKTCVEVPVLIIAPFLYIIIIYFWIGFTNTSAAFWGFALPVLLNA